MEQKTKKKKSCRFISYILFIVNALAAVLVTVGIKHKDESRLTSDSLSKESNVVPVDQNILNLQRNIMVNRENKLRDLNTEAKELKQLDTTTTTTTTTVVEEELKPDTKTKSS